MLAYSSIAHAGYTLVVVCGSDDYEADPETERRRAYAAVAVFYLLGYSLVKVGAFFRLFRRLADKANAI